MSIPATASIICIHYFFFFSLPSCSTLLYFNNFAFSLAHLVSFCGDRARLLCITCPIMHHAFAVLPDPSPFDTTRHSVALLFHTYIYIHTLCRVYCPFDLGTTWLPPPPPLIRIIEVLRDVWYLSDLFKLVVTRCSLWIKPFYFWTFWCSGTNKVQVRDLKKVM